MRALLAMLVVPLWLAAAQAAEVGGVELPAVRDVGGKTLRLNGYGLRTWSLLGIHIYVAGLYVEHVSSDAEAIMRSAETKLLIFNFRHEVSAERAREAWRKALAANCPEPCRLESADVERFLAEVPAMREGDTFELRFAEHSAVITANGRLIGHIDQPVLADAVLAAFLGPRPGSPEVKQALLERHG